MRGQFGLSVQQQLMASGAALVIMVSASPAMAQTRTFDVPAQPALRGIPTFAKQAGIQIVASGSAVRGKRTNAVRGSYSVEEALRRLLEGTGLKASPLGTNGIITIQGTGPGEAEDGSAPAGNESADILVTGTRIRGVQSPSPMVVTTRERIQDQGIDDLGSFARNLTQNYNGGQNPTVAGGGNQGRQNNLTSSSSLNLRGLGADATLTLINGHRTSYDGIGQGVDISAIPVVAIERVEIVTDGASALYGSDAVAGVANVILRRDFTGLYTSARIAGSTDGGNFQQQYDLVGGTHWGSGGFMGVLDYSDITAINARDRDYTRNLDDSQTLVPAREQVSVILAGHQQLSNGATLELDGQFADRSAETRFPYTTTSSAFTLGNVPHVDTTSYTITPTLRFALPGRWQASLSGTHGRSNVDIDTRAFSAGVLTTRTGLAYDNSIDALEATGEGPLFNLPASDVRLAVGGGYRRVGLDVLIQQTSGGTTTTTSDTSNSRQIYFGYGELSVPLVGQANRLPLVESLDLSGALRYENYRGVGDVLVPKLGIVYRPVRDITLRGTWGRSFKAQTLFQEFQATEAIFAPGYYFPNFPADQYVLLLSGGNAGLRPERATNWTASIEVRPVNGLTLQASYFNIQFKDRVVTPATSSTSAFSNPANADLLTYNPTLAQIAAAVAAATNGVTNLSSVAYSPSLVAAIVDNRLRNAARQAIQGVDLSADYRMDIGPSETLQLIASASYLESDQQLTPLNPVVDLAGTIFNSPHWRARGGGIYRRDNVTVSAFVNHVGGTSDTRYTPAEPVRSFTTVDLVARLRSTESAGLAQGIEATVAVSNLFNQAPSPIRNSSLIDPPYDSTNQSAAGRVISLTIAKKW
ncbi:TonB-dependent receptor domain-containing protein [Sphingomonas sp. IW22]|jgi:iron complex outermembrane receptor protein|uniref:TonB-dependent receptor domain-containing protein n=1 Tax=Sphingomonas sp. IW22 TaxID=3242489 RepID=UPI00352123E6